MRLAVSVGDRSPVTRLNLALAEEAAGDPECARGLMRAVAAAEAEWAEPLVRLAESWRAAGRPEAAEATYRQALERNPRHPEALTALSGLLLLRGAALEARDLLVRCLGIVPDRAEVWDALGIALMGTREPLVALSAFVEAQRLAPGSIEYALRGVEAAIAAADTDAEEARLAQSRTEDPANPVIAIAHGVLLERMGERAEAIDALTAAAVLAPDAVVPVSLLGGVMARTGRLKEAEAALRRAGELDPENVRVANDRAAVLMRMHRHAEAREILTRVIDHAGESVTLYCNLANATACLGMQDEAVAFARRAIALDPRAALPRRALCNTLPYQDGVTGAALLAAARDLDRRLPRETLSPFANDPDPDRPLVVGLLSGTLKSHPVGWLTVAGFETLDPEQFACLCLAQNAAHTDLMARRYRAMARDWIDIDTMSDIGLARLARERGIDILIDLGGYGDAARMTACAHRLAPVQIKWVGMQNHSSGLTEMDWFLTDRWETPPGFEPLYSEQLLCLADGYVCYSPPPYAPDVVSLPALANGFVTFGCFNNLAKITPRVIEVWGQVLRAVSDSRIVLKTHQFSDSRTRERLFRAFVAQGVAAERIELRAGSGHRAFMGEYNHIDLVLDPFPYSGGLTTCEALWMGVPTVTLPGDTFSSRHSASHLSNAGLGDWLAGDCASYVELAVRWARRVPDLAALRAGLREQVRRSPLCDAPRFGRSLGQALRRSWAAWCAERG